MGEELLYTEEKSHTHPADHIHVSRVAHTSQMVVGWKSCDQNIQMTWWLRFRWVCPVASVRKLFRKNNIFVLLHRNSSLELDILLLDISAPHFQCEIILGVMKFLNVIKIVRLKLHFISFLLHEDYRCDHVFFKELKISSTCSLLQVAKECPSLVASEMQTLQQIPTSF